VQNQSCMGALHGGDGRSTGSQLIRREWTSTKKDRGIGSFQLYKNVVMLCDYKGGASFLYPYPVNLSWPYPDRGKARDDRRA